MVGVRVWVSGFWALGLRRVLGLGLLGFDLGLGFFLILLNV